MTSSLLLQNKPLILGLEYNIVNTDNTFIIFFIALLFNTVEVFLE